MSRLFVIDVERRNWAERIRAARRGNGNGDGNGNGVRPLGVTRRYLMIIEHPEIRDIIKREFNSSPHAIHPHESGNPFIFYCIAGPSCRRPKKLIDALQYKLRKNNVPESDISDLEVITAE